MALAYIQYKGQENGELFFNADIGTANYFRYVLGEEKKKIKTGYKQYVEVLSGEIKKSPLYATNSALHRIQVGTFMLKVPEALITEKIKYIQLHSYSTKELSAPTISKTLQLYLNKRSSLKWEGQSESFQINGSSQNYNTMPNYNVSNKSFLYKEPKLSQVMFWNTIISALPTIVKYAAPVLGGLLSGLDKNNSDKNKKPENGDSNSKVNEAINSIIQLLTSLANDKNAKPEVPATNAAPTTATAKSLSTVSSAYTIQPETIVGLKPILEKILTPEAIRVIGDQPRKLFMVLKDAVQKTEVGQGISLGINKPLAKNKVKAPLPLVQNFSYKKKGHTTENYSKAKIAPAVLAALPALIPLLEKVLDPKMIEAIGDQPVKIFKAIGDTVLKMDQQELDHLEKLNPGVDSADDINKLLAGMSISTSAARETRIAFKMIKNLNLNFTQVNTVFFRNKDRVLYSKTEKAAIPFRITGVESKIIDRVIIQVIVQDVETMKILLSKSFRLKAVDLKNEITEVVLNPVEIEGLPGNKELKLEVSVVWKSNKNENIGIFKNQYISFIDQLAFDRWGEQIGESIPLNNIEQHRNFWHKVWEGGFSESRRWNIEFDVKYFYFLQLKDDNLSKLETRKLILEDNNKNVEDHPNRRKVHAKLKSGMEFSLAALNDFSKNSGNPTLNDKELQALRTTEFTKDFHRIARIRVEMEGKGGDTGTLWTYPEISFYKIHYSSSGIVNEFGQVTSLESVERIFAKPKLIHFIGTKSER